MSPVVTRRKSMLRQVHDSLIRLSISKVNCHFFDEIRSPNNEAFFYFNNDFGTVASRLSLAKLSAFSMSPTGVTADKVHHVVAFVPCKVQLL